MAEITLRTSKGGIKTWLGRANGRAQVEAVSYFAEEAAGEDGDAYIFHGECRTDAAAAGALMYIKNTSSTKNIRIGRLYFDPQTLTDADLLVTQWITPTTTTGGTDITTSGIIQKKTSAPNALASTGCILKISDASSDMTFTGGSRFHTFPLNSRTSSQRDMKGTNIVGPGGEWFLGYKLEDGSSAVGDQIIGISINCYIEEAIRE